MMIVEFKTRTYSDRYWNPSGEFFVYKEIDGLFYIRCKAVVKVSPGKNGVHVWTDKKNNYFISFYDAFDVRIFMEGD